MITDAKSFGEALRKRRKELGYTQDGDYLLPDLLPGNEEHTVGIWGRRHARSLQADAACAPGNNDNFIHNIYPSLEYFKL